MQLRTPRDDWNDMRSNAEAASNVVQQARSHLGNGSAVYGDQRPEPTPDVPTGEPITALDCINAANLSGELLNIDDELIEGVVGRDTLAVLYGDSNSGKTFLAIDIAASIAIDAHWFGRNLVGGIVLYLASEAPGSVEMRLRGYKREHGVPLERLYVVRTPVNLFDCDADVRAVIGQVHAIEQVTGEKVVLIVGDTLARLATGANENSGEDMGVVLRNADRIRREARAAFLLIHHTGKNAAAGMRGWSGMRAAIDTEIEITGADASGVHVAEITKQRDLPGKGARLGFTLRPVVIGRNSWGADRTTCVVASNEAPPKPQRNGKRKRESEIAGALFEVLTHHKAGMSSTALAKHLSRYDGSSVHREVRKQIAAGVLTRASGIVTLAR
jgi:hypothetical protein